MEFLTLEVRLIEELSIRTELQPGDIGYITYMHGKIYKDEYGYGIGFEKYVAQGMLEFTENYLPGRDRIWLAEHDGKIVATIVLMHRGESTAQLRYYLVDPPYRGIGLGRKLMDLFMEYYHTCGYKSCYLLTTHQLRAAAEIYIKYGFELTGEHESEAFGQKVVEQRYELKPS